MKKFFLTALSILILLIVNNSNIISQTATTTVTYSGFQSCGGCAVCGADYWCTNTPGSYCGNTAACDSKTFFDPVPAGHVVTNVTINYWAASCEGAAINGSINGFSVPVAYDGNTGCLCSDNPCSLASSTTANYPCGMPGYVYGGTNTFQLCSSGPMCINRAEFVFTYVDPDVITPNITASGPLAFCNGGSVTLNANSGYSAYLWNTGATSQGITVTNSGTYSVSITSITGCNTGSSSVTVTESPNITIAVSATPNAICKGQCSNLIASGATNYSWMPGNLNGSSVNVCPLTNTTYTVIGTDNMSCSDTVTQNVVVYPQPILNLGNDTIFCQGQNVILNAQNPGCNYNWSTGSINQTITVSSAGTYTATVTNSNNCKVVDQIILYNHSLPTPDITGLTPVCANSITAYSTLANTSSTYSWTVSGGGITNGAGTNSILVNWNNPPSANISLTETFIATGCSATDNLQFTILPALPPFSFSPIPSFCPYDNAYILNNALPIGGVYSINNNIVTQIIPSLYTTGNHSVLYRYTNSDGCTDTISRVFTIKPSPLLSSTLSETEICYGNSVQLNVTGAGNYSWTPSIGLNNASIGNPIATPLSSTTYTLIGGNSNLCYDTIQINIQVHPLPVITLLNIPNFCPDDNEFTINIAQPIGGTYTLDGIVANTIKPNQLIQGSHIVNYSYTDIYNCFSDTSITFSIYPKPQVSIIPSDTSICGGDSLILHALGADLYRWSPFYYIHDSIGNNILATPRADIQYRLIGSNLYGCKDTAYSWVYPKTKPIVNIGNDHIFCPPETIVLNSGNSNTNYSIEWSDGSNYSTLFVDFPGIYWVRVINDGCISSDTIELIPCVDLWIPNCFTPDNSSLNDYFYAVCSDPSIIIDFEMYVYNRWGGLIYESKSLDDKWDGTYNGKSCDYGVYNWVIRYSTKGANHEKMYFKRWGTVTLIR